jgi:hypothetical protein
MTSFVPVQTIGLQYLFYSGYVDQCHPHNPNCVTGVTCTDCNDGFNPSLDVNCNLITYFDTAVALSVNEEEYINFALFPNPSSGLFTITSGNQFNRNYVVSVFNVIGNLEKQFNWNGERMSLNLTAYSKGVYIVKVSNGKSTEFKKLIIH